MEKLLKRPFFFLALACSSLFYLPLGLRALWDPSEGRTAEIAREMLELKEWILPHLNYVLYLDKPPLMYWLTALSLKVFGATPFAARFSCAALGLLTIYATYRWGRNWKNERVGLLAGGILATSVGFFALTQYAALDMAATFWNTLTLLAGSGLLVERSAQRARRLTFGLAIGLGGGVLSQGFTSLLLPAAVLSAVYVSQGRRIPVVKRPWKAAVILFTLIALPWFVAVTLKYPAFPYYFLMHEHLQRYGSDLRAGQSVLFFVPVFFLGFLPWIVFLPRVMQTWFAHRHAALQRDPEGAVMVSWICLVFVFFSLFPSKLASSILPIFPALALLIAHEFDEALESSDSAEARVLPGWVAQGVVALMILLFVGLVFIKLPPHVLLANLPEWKAVIDQSALLALALGLGIFILVGVWGMQDTLTCIGAVMLVQVFLLTSSASLAPELDPYRSSRLVADRFQARAANSDAVALFRPTAQNFPYSFLFYTGRRASVFGPVGELTFGQSRDPEGSEPWFVPEDKADEAARALPAPSWVLTDGENGPALRQLGPDLFQSISQSGGKLLLRKQQ